MPRPPRLLAARFLYSLGVCLTLVYLHAGGLIGTGALVALVLLSVVAQVLAERALLPLLRHMGWLRSPHG